LGLQVTVDPDTKLLPLIVRVKLGVFSGMLAGESEEIVGTRFAALTVNVAAAVPPLAVGPIAFTSPDANPNLDVPGMRSSFESNSPACNPTTHAVEPPLRKN
jgi:hypothetical protein